MGKVPECLISSLRLYFFTTKGSTIAIRRKKNTKAICVWDIDKCVIDKHKTRHQEGLTTSIEVSPYNAFNALMTGFLR